MSKKNIWMFVTSIILFAVLLGLSALLQEEMLIYAASAVPILIVLFLPDAKRYQYIRGRNRNVSIYKQGDGEEAILVIAFQPGFLRWKTGMAYFHLKDIASEPQHGGAAQQNAATIPVLAFDLSAHHRKTGWIGINLTQLASRTANMSFTTDEVNRLVIPMKDLEETALTMMSSSATASQNKSKSISA
ncbi:hypothetical protein DVH26_33680 [Paenibacillus sp. H1-7]|uniref:hypothetical protein n=1 Tax=Paenibacillus sp. H1-7 TaxID=2282849 RepID=UPI001EF97AAD|nr:hypothetical protein [Paenibacillus sp. H1-7]ULL18953.1 hypothetical protein DVH26_33680 [Paenibacillus sp. H1-7]